MESLDTTLQSESVVASEASRQPAVTPDTSYDMTRLIDCMSSCPTIPESDYQSGDGPRHFLLPGNVVTYMPIEDVEVIGRYRPGGYHPVTIGDQLHGTS
jgi:hypothetical protein